MTHEFADAPTRAPRIVEVGAIDEAYILIEPELELEARHHRDGSQADEYQEYDALGVLVEDHWDIVVLEGSADPLLSLGDDFFSLDTENDIGAIILDSLAVQCESRKEEGDLKEEVSND